VPKPPTMDDVANEAGVSRALVSLVMRESPKVSERRRQAVLDAADRLGYRPNILARNLASRRTQTLGVLINDLHNPFFSELVEGIEREAEDQNLRVLILNGGRNVNREQNAIETFLQFRVDGVVLVGSLLDDHQLAAAARLTPSVVVASGWNQANVDAVTSDDDRGAALAVGHLVSLGHRKIVHLDGAQNVSAEGRRDGYVRAMRAHGLEPRIVLAGDDENDARVAIDRIMESADQPTAIFAFNDLVAAGALDRLDDLGLDVPEHISLIGYDNTFIADLHRLSLTTINQPRVRMGRLAVSTLTQRIEDAEGETVQMRLEPELVLRGTTAAPLS
jgi:DNA-binding LacI/PurR family transcriptional regulator